MHVEIVKTLAIVMITASVVSIVFHRMRLPVVSGYIMAGILIGPFAPWFRIVGSPEMVEKMAELGVVFLLFSLGLEFSLRKLAGVGLGAGMAAVLEMALMFWIGNHVGRWLGWTGMNSLFLGAMLTISSSVVIFKTLEHMRALRSVFGEFMLGILVFEDILGVCMLGLLSGIAMTRQVNFAGVLLSLGKVSVFMTSVVVIGLLVVPPFLRYLRRLQSAEMLLIGVLGICFSVCLLAIETGLSVALGAFLSGAVIAETGVRRAVIRLIEPVRDLFSAVFFVTVGMLTDPAAVFEYAVPIAVITGCVLLFKSTACALGALLAGHGLGSAVAVWLGMGQVGEFSFIIASLGLSLGVIDPRLFPIAVSVSVLTITLAPMLLERHEAVAMRAEKCAPAPILAALIAYGQWVSSLRGSRPEYGPVRVVLRRSLLQILVNLLLCTGFFLVAISLAQRFEQNLEWTQRLALLAGYVSTIFWFGAVMVSLPFLVAIVRKAQAVAMILAEMATPASIAPGQAQSFRSIVTTIIRTTALTLVFAWLLMVSALILPPWPMLAVLAALAALLAVLLRAPDSHLLARPDHDPRDF
ncbi:MAG TPA: cation:proton antiporter [Candidatus Hydrogenedentes bacterium]|nr:cation:proton antiporter [Candidatus Hydrogenedentota bacterium]